MSIPNNIRNFVVILSNNDMERIAKYERMLSDYEKHYQKKNSHLTPMEMQLSLATDKNRDIILSALIRVRSEAIPINFNYD